jgi:hypothetical protein
VLTASQEFGAITPNVQKSGPEHTLKQKIKRIGSKPPRFGLSGPLGAEREKGFT